WSEQFYHYVVKHWLEGDPAQPPPPAERGHGRNSDWMHVYNRDVLSVPDKWEYPWYASWDLAFHMIPLASVDPEFAKQQLILFMREWYMHASGQLPAYEFSFSDANPPVHAWACWRVYKMTGPRGGRDRHFLARVFHKLMINFTWWVNRKDRTGNNLFSGGFLGLDNIGVFDRSRPLPTGGELEQADATAWMAFFCSTMLTMALELAREDPVYEDVASKFFEHFVAIADAINTLGGTGLWDETDGFYYDQLDLDGARFPLRVRSLVGAVPLFAAEVLELSALDKLPGFRSRLEWFLANRQDLTDCISYDEMRGKKAHGHFLIAIPTRQRLERVLRTLLAEDEFLSPWGIRSLSKFHERHPYVLDHDDGEHRVRYTPGEADSRLFGGNSNWRGPVWLPMNYLIVEALERYHRYYRNELMVECPTGSGRWMTLKEVAKEIAARVARLFLPDRAGRRPCHGDDPRWAFDPHWRDLVLFHEYYHAETGRGLGASHQTGWTSLAARFMAELAPAHGTPPGDAI
ncbi:MAG: glucosidase, partial [Acidobacteria bacterium]